MPAPRPFVQLASAHHDRTLPAGVQHTVGPLSLDIQEGEFLSVIGPAGCGKTTLLKMIAGLLPLSGGTLSVAGAERKPPGCKFGLALHEPALLPWRTSLQNVLIQAEFQDLDPAESGHRARRLLAWFGLSDYENRRPHELPPGTSCAVSICRALVHNPSLLLLDDPFRSLDSLSLERMLDGFQRLWAEAGCTAFLCTCNMLEAILLSDRVAVMSNAPGRILDCLAIDLPRPRRLDKATAPQIAEYRSRIRMLFRAHGILP
jgi:NitT/TauT family transport system ATP-binding protein